MDNCATVEYLREAYKEAVKSPDPSNQNGAILVEREWSKHFCYTEEIVAYGYNTFPPQIPITPELLNDRDQKLFFIEHAERYCIYNGVRNRANFDRCTLYVPWFACSDCARAIGLVGIRKVIGHKQRMDTTPERWKKSVDAGLDYLIKLGVELEFYDGPIFDAPSILVNGQFWNPNLKQI